MARTRSDKNLARFDRIALILSGGAGLGAYQAGAYAALENCGVRPNWIAGTAIGAINATIIAGNLPHERTFRLRQFWHELSRRVAARKRGGTGRRIRRLLTARLPSYVARGHTGDRPGMVTGELRDLLQASADFDEVGYSMVEVVKTTARLTEEDRRAIAIFLQAVPPVPGPRRR